MPAFRYTLLDVFTETPLEGNGLAVVHAADALDEAAMLAFAREMRLSETTFVQTATAEAADAGADYRNRIWTVTQELPFAGHPSLGTAVAVAYAAGAQGASHYVQQTGAGLQPIDVQLDGQRATASMLQEPAVFGPEVDRAEALAAIGLEPADADPALPPQIVSTGLAQLIVPLRDDDAVARIRPDWEAIAALLVPLGAITLYAAACDPPNGQAHARSFPYSEDIGEDPATGSAAGPLCAYLAARTDCVRVAVDQGIEMGRPSRLDAAMEGDRPRVAGGVIVLIDGTLHL
ncbi:MAG: phenazine biosynthesis protein PhzF [Conexibacter sp.]|nr:phenazine biosynthesis protein PhzF [Conexibacter sp.]